MTISSTNTKNSYSGDGTTVAFSYTFKILDDDDIQVILRTDATGTETVQTKTTDYTVSGVGNAGGGTITFGSAPAATETVVLLRNVPLTQTTDYTPNDPFPAATHEDALDKLTLMAQDTQEEVDRSIKLSRTNTMTSTEFTVGATTRANKIFAFDSSGELAVTQEIGTFQGDWAASTAYAERDLVKDTSTNNIFIVNSAHTSSGSQPLTTNPNSSKYDLIVDAAAATTSATNAASSATAAAASATAAAASESAAATSETNAAASEAGVAADAAAAAASAASASTSATNASTSETNASNSASAASTSATNAATSATSASNSASAAGTSETNAATSATNASNSASAAATSASNAATSESNASTSETNAATSASSAASDASAAATSAAAAAASFDAFDDIYLGAKASAPTQDNDGDALTEGDQYFNTTNNTLFVWNGSAWQAASPDIVGDTTPQLGGDLDTNGNDINFGDNDKAIFGAGSDLQIYHDGTNSQVQDAGGGFLKLSTNGTKINFRDTANGSDMANMTTGGAVELLHAGSTKFTTTSSGIDVTGTVTADLLTVDGTGASSFTSTSTTPLQINGASIPTLRVNNTVGSVSTDVRATTTEGLIRTSTNHPLVLGTNQLERMRITSGGSVGIGTDSPSAKLHLKANASGGTAQSRSALVIEDDDGNADSIQFLCNDTGFQSIFFGDASDNDVGRIAYSHSGNSMRFNTNGSEAARIDSSGNLLVGTTSTDIVDTTPADTTGCVINSSGRVDISNTGLTQILNRSGTDGDIALFRKDGTTVGAVGTQTGDFRIHSTESGHVGLRFANGQILPVSNTGGLTDNVADLGSSVHRYNDIFLGGGAYIGGTAAANRLDDYEEGSNASANVYDSTGTLLTAGTDYTLGSNSYTKIGQMVFVAIRIRDLRGSKGDFHVDAPFTISVTDRQYGVHFGGTGADSRIDNSSQSASTRVRLRGNGEYKYGFYSIFT